jgi:hypothetical protein
MVYLLNSVRLPRLSLVLVLVLVPPYMHLSISSYAPTCHFRFDTNGLYMYVLLHE